MNENEYDAYREEEAQVNLPAVAASQFGGDNRTLTYGYDTDRNSFHVYLCDGNLHRRHYGRNGEILASASGPELPAETLRPNKRVYPEYTDGTFARIMRDMDFDLPFTTWGEPRRPGPYYGATHLGPR